MSNSKKVTTSTYKVEPNAVFFVNVPGKEYDEDSISSFKKFFWDNKPNDEQDNVCRSCGKEESPEELVGGHVKYDKNSSDEIFITQICKKCNHCTNKEVFRVNKGDFIKVPCQQPKDKLKGIIENISEDTATYDCIFSKNDCFIGLKSYQRPNTW
jgi:hypothetical protein